MSALFAQMRFRPAPLWVAGAIGSAIGGAVLLALGLLGPLGWVAAGAAILVAMAAFHWGKGFVGQPGGVEMPLLYLVAASVVGIVGPGGYSLDAALGIALPEPLTGLVAAGTAVAGVIAALAGRRPAAGARTSTLAA